MDCGNNHLIGVDSSQGLPDTNHTLVPSLHDFTYDVYFWSGRIGLAQAVEFDINQFFNNQVFNPGHECRVAGGKSSRTSGIPPGSTGSPTVFPGHPDSNGGMTDPAGWKTLFNKSSR